MTDEEFEVWLRASTAIRMVLVEADVLVGAVETTRYMSTHGYNTSPSDSPANTNYQAIITTGVQFVESISLDSEASLSAGDIEIENTNGERDSWADDVWANRGVRAYVGDPRWPRADFRMIFNGVIADIAPKGATTLALKLRDKLQRLNTPVTETKLGGSTKNKDDVLPLSFGEVHNVTPLLRDPTMLSYQIHDGPVESIVEVRDNGMPVAFTGHNTTGIFELTYSPAGAITVSAQGDKNPTYVTTVADVVRRLVTGYGKVSDRFTVDDLDEDSLDDFDTLHPQPVGLWLSDRTNVLNACQMVAGSLGAQLVMSRLGKLRILQVNLPPSGTPVEIHPHHMVQFSLAPVSRTDVVASVKLGFNKSWTIQSTLLTTIPAQHKDLYAKEWLTVTQTDEAVKDTYRLNVDPEQEDTMLLTTSDANAEATRRLEMRKVPRTIYEFEGTPEMLTLELGQAVTVYSPRYGMAAGVLGMVVSLSPDWLTGHVKVGFIV